MTSQNIIDSNGSWTKIIRPKRRPARFTPAGIVARPRIDHALRVADFVSVYKQTVLGPLWFVIQPVLTTIVFTVIFGNIAKLPTDGLPPFLFYMAGNTIWAYFSVPAW